MIRLIGGALVGALLTLTTANAGMIVDTVNQSQFVEWFGSHSYTHDINDDGFTLGSALSGTLAIDISDDQDGFLEG